MPGVEVSVMSLLVCVVTTSVWGPDPPPSVMEFETTSTGVFVPEGVSVAVVASETERLPTVWVFCRANVAGPVKLRAVAVGRRLAVLAPIESTPAESVVAPV